MKKNQILLITLVVLVFSIVSCKKNDESGSTFSCKLDGADYSVSGFWAYAFDFDTYYNIYGVKDEGNGASMYISIPRDAKAGTTYTFSADYPAYYVQDAQNAFSTVWGAGSGEVKVESISDTHVKGTFRFNAFDSTTGTVKKAITDGKFDVDIR